MKQIKKVLNLVEEHGLYPDTKLVSSAPSPEITIGERSYISFCSNNYLGLSIHPEVKKASIESTQKYGTGAESASLGSGTYDVHRELERVIANFKQTEDAMLFPAGYMANIGIIQAVMDIVDILPIPSIFKKRGIILSDALNHSSIIDGCRLSNAKTVVYKHRDIKDLETKLRRYKRRRKLIVTDGVFSLDGDIAPLPQIVELAKKYNALVMVDEAHATGVLGENGGGTVEHFHLEGQVEITMGTFGKALGVLGGYVAGNKELIKYLKIGARTYVFATAMPPATAGALIGAFNVIKNSPELRKRLWENTDRLRKGFNERGFDTMNSETPIIPVLIGKEEKAIEASRLLFEKGFFAFCVRFPGVPRNMARIRFTVMSLHTEKQIDVLLEEFEKIGKNLGIIN